MKRKLSDATSPIICYCDGACPGNGTIKAKGGIGVHFPGKEYPEISERLAPTFFQTNQVAELFAAIKVLQTVALKDEIHVITDSTYVMNIARTWLKTWKALGWKRKQGRKLLPVKNLELVQLFDSLLTEKEKVTKTHWSWVKGHSGNAGNDAADKLAKTCLLK